VAWTAYRAKIETLLDELSDKSLADGWRRVCPLSIGQACGAPDRRGMIQDLADFAVVLRPNLSGMKADRLCWLVEKYAAWESRPSGLSLFPPARRKGTRVFRGKGDCCERIANLRG
jgi:hypothetical protein